MAFTSVCFRKVPRISLLKKCPCSSWLLAVRTIKTSGRDCKDLVPQEISYSYLIDKAKEDLTLAERDKFTSALDAYLSLEKYRRGHVKFIKEGLGRMDDFGLQKDLVSYNRLIDLFPRGHFNNKRFFDTLWPRSYPQTELALDLLQKMEDNGIRPNRVTYDVLCEIFGRQSLPVEKCIRIAIWFDRFEDIDPYRIIGEVPSDPFTISKMAFDRICGKDCKVWKVKAPEEDSESFVIAASSKRQVGLLESKDFSEEAVLYVEGPHLMWLQKIPLFYYSLRLLPPAKPEAEDYDNEETSDGHILGVCSCQPPTQESLTLWIQSLHNEYPHTKAATVVYDVTIWNEAYYSELRTLNATIPQIR